MLHTSLSNVAVACCLVFLLGAAALAQDTAVPPPLTAGALPNGAVSLIPRTSPSAAVPQADTVEASWSDTPVPDPALAHDARPLGGARGESEEAKAAGTAPAGGLDRAEPRRFGALGLGELLRVGGALAVVIGLLVLLRLLVRRTCGLTLAAGRPSGVLEILARYPVARGQQLVLLKMAAPHPARPPERQRDDHALRAHRSERGRVTPVAGGSGFAEERRPPIPERAAALAERASSRRAGCARPGRAGTRDVGRNRRSHAEPSRGTAIDQRRSGRRPRTRRVRGVYRDCIGSGDRSLRRPVPLSPRGSGGRGPGHAGHGGRAQRRAEHRSAAHGALARAGDHAALHVLHAHRDRPGPVAAGAGHAGTAAESGRGRAQPLHHARRHGADARADVRRGHPALYERGDQRATPKRGSDRSSRSATSCSRRSRPRGTGRACT